MLELSGWVSVGSFVSRSQPGAFLFVSSVFRRMGVAQKRVLVFVTRSGGFPTSSLDNSKIKEFITASHTYVWIYVDVQFDAACGDLGPSVHCVPRCLALYS